MNENDQKPVAKRGRPAKSNPASEMLGNIGTALGVKVIKNKEWITSLTESEIKSAVVSMDKDAARILITTYYNLQKQRIRIGNQAFALSQSGKQSMMLDAMHAQLEAQEETIKKSLDQWTLRTAAGQWLRSIHGIGPVLAAGLIAFIDIKRAKSYGSVHRYAGLDPTCVWHKGERCPWNRDLKNIASKCGLSFVKSSGSEGAFYGKLYKERVAQEVEKNMQGLLREQAERELATKNWANDNVTRRTLQEGKLTKAHINARARRYATKIFLAHFFEFLYMEEYNEKPPVPYAIAHMNHVGYVRMQNSGEYTQFIDDREKEIDELMAARGIDADIDDLNLDE